MASEPSSKPLAPSSSTGRGVLAVQALGAVFAYIGSAFIATSEAGAASEYKDMIVQSSASDIVYSNLSTGVHCNYLRPSIERAGLDPDSLPTSDPSTMNLASGGFTSAKLGKTSGAAVRVSARSYECVPSSGSSPIWDETTLRQGRC